LDVGQNRKLIFFSNKIENEVKFFIFYGDYFYYPIVLFQRDLSKSGCVGAQIEQKFQKKHDG
jgi:hypothetical protein